MSDHGLLRRGRRRVAGSSGRYADCVGHDGEARVASDSQIDGPATELLVVAVQECDHPVAILKGAPRMAGRLALTLCFLR